jgi:mannobiose 2-epimerase
MLKYILFILLFFMLNASSCRQQESGNKYKPSDGPLYLNVPVKDIESELHGFLKAWYPVLMDTINGGYWTNLASDFSLLKNQDKMLVTQARGLWTAAKAAAVFPENPLFRKAAGHGYKFLTEKMWDHELGGFKQIYLIESAVSPNEIKTTYANSFALFALSEYYKINPHPQVLEWVKKSFNWIEQIARDPQFHGYYNIITSANELTKQNTRWGRGDLKDQNTSIHLLEAFTNTYHIWPDSLVKVRLREILELIRDKMVNEKGYLNLFFNRNWQPVSHVDSSHTFILNNIYTDHVSFGHDIETAYLLIDASLALNNKTDHQTLTVAKKLIDHSLAYGFDRDYHGLYDKGYYFKHKKEIEIVIRDKVWWSQAEAWHTLALASKYYPRDDVYPKAFEQMWKYIKEQMIDPQNHGWYNNGLDSDPGNKDSAKGHQWKGAYHDGRALMQVYLYAREKLNGQKDIH